MKRFIWKSEYFVALVLFAAFVIGFVVSLDYGSYCDHPIEENICMMNVAEYTNRFLHTDFPTMAESVEKDHGVAVYYPLGVLCLQRGQTSFTSDIWHYYTFVLFFCGCLALYGIIYELFESHKLSLTVFGLYYLSPRFFAEGHYNNKDIILLTLGLITAYFGMKYIRSRKLWWGLLFAVSAAFMTNVKIIGVWFFAVVGLTYLIWNIWDKKLSPSKILDGILVIATFFFVFAMITPASWNGFMFYVKYCLTNASSFSRWRGNVVYAGRRYLLPDEQLPWDYLPLQILYTTPLVLLALCLAGHVVALIAIVKRKKNAGFYLMFFLLYFVPFLYAVTNRNLVVYNGWRHFYFLYGPLVVFMGAGCEALVRQVKRKTVGYGVLGGVLVYLLILVAAGHPFQYSYLNSLASRPAQENWQLDYWCVGEYRLLNQLYESPMRDKTKELTLMAEGAATLSYTTSRYGDLWNYEIRLVEEGDQEQANYVIRNLTYSNEMTREGYHLLFTIEAYGNLLYEVYERD